MNSEYLTQNEEDTAKIAAAISKEIRNNQIIFLRGDLGAGKTVFARSLIRELCHDLNMDVPSPTFSLVQTYDYAMGSIWHFDLYRLEDEDELYELGWEEALDQNIVIIEWSERLENLKPPEYLDIQFSSVDNSPSARKILIKHVG